MSAESGTATLGNSSPDASNPPTSGFVSDASIKLGWTSSIVSLDPATITTAASYHLLYSIYDRLLSLEPGTMTLAPGLATEWGFEGENNLLFRMKLRQGVTFQDGEPFNAQAVKTSLERFFPLGLLVPIKHVTEVEVVGDYEVVLHLSEPTSDLPYTLADVGGMIVSPKSIQTDPDGIATKPVGAGRYRAVSVEPGSKVVLERFDKYWNFNGAAPARVEWDYYRDSISMVNAMKSGSLDGLINPVFADVSTLQKTSGFQVTIAPRLSWRGFYLNASVEPTKNPDVRRALNMALDRDELMQLATEGQGFVTSQPYPEGHAAHIAGLDYKYDPDQAKSLLAGAGYSNGFKLDCITLGAAALPPTLIPTLTSQLSKVGIDVNFRDLAPSEGVTEFFAVDGPPCLLSGWAGQISTYTTLHSLFGSDGSYNAGKTDFGVDADLGELAATVDADAQAEIAQRIIQKTFDSAGAAIMYGDPAVIMLRDGISMDPIGLLYPDFSSLVMKQ
ncbi:MAG: ABC transporter substrate-binding protein [Ilumatobacteraceae bacterium]